MAIFTDEAMAAAAKTWAGAKTLGKVVGVGAAVVGTFYLIKKFYDKFVPDTASSAAVEAVAQRAEAAKAATDKASAVAPGAMALQPHLTHTKDLIAATRARVIEAAVKPAAEKAAAKFDAAVAPSSVPKA